MNLDLLYDPRGCVGSLPVVKLMSLRHNIQYTYIAGPQYSLQYTYIIGPGIYVNCILWPSDKCRLYIVAQGPWATIYNVHITLDSGPQYIPCIFSVLFTTLPQEVVAVIYLPLRDELLYSVALKKKLINVSFCCVCHITHTISRSVQRMFLNANKAAG